VSPVLLLGLDVGTTAIKAAVIDADGREVAHGRARTPWREVPTGAEMDPDALLTSALEAAAAALDEAPEGDVAGIGVASMAETGVLLDRDGRPAVPSIAWHDTRGAEEAARLRRDIGGHDFASRTGLPASELCSLPKYRWMRDHRDGTDRGVRWLNVAEWIVRGLGGEEAAELSLASRTGFYDLRARRPWDAALAWADAPEGLMPDAVPAGTALGRHTTGALTRAADAVLTVGGHDHLAAAVGAGAAGPGEVLDSCGTAEAFVRSIEPLAQDTVAATVISGISVGWHAVDGRQALLGAVWSGSALGRVLALLGVPVEERQAIEAAARDADPGALAVHGLDDAQLTLTGIERHASPAAAYRAALEAVATAGASVLDRMAAAAGSPATRLVVTGGWAAGEAAQAVKRAHLGEFERSPTIFTGARGAALAAGRAAGMWTIDDAPRAGGAPQEVSR
jgi:sugar (pentulose or hexulose) kinase